MHKLAESRVLSKFHLINGYWKLPHDESSKASQSLITMGGIFSPTRLLHGSNIAFMYLHSTLASKIPSDLLHQVLYWLDVVLWHSKTVDELLGAIELYCSHSACNIILSCTRRNVNYTLKQIDGADDSPHRKLFDLTRRVSNESRKCNCLQLVHS